MKEFEIIEARELGYERGRHRDLDLKRGSEAYVPQRVTQIEGRTRFHYGRLFRVKLVSWGDESVRVKYLETSKRVILDRKGNYLEEKVDFKKGSFLRIVGDFGRFVRVE